MTTIILVQEIDETANQFASRISIELDKIDSARFLHISFTTSSNGRQTFNLIST